jgi:hypothetical protein
MLRKKILSMFTLSALICTSLMMQVLPAFADDSGDYDDLLEEADLWCEDYSCDSYSYDLDWVEDWLDDWGWMSEYDTTTDVYVVWDDILGPFKIDELLEMYDEYMDSNEITPSGDYSYEDDADEPDEESDAVYEPTYEELLEDFQSEFNYWCEDYSCVDDDYLCDEDWLEDWLDAWGWMAYSEDADEVGAAFEIWSDNYDAELVDIWLVYADEYFDTNEIVLDCDPDEEDPYEDDDDEDYDYEYYYDDPYDQEYQNQYEEEVDEWCASYGCDDVDLDDQAWVEAWVRDWGFDIFYDVWDPILGYDVVDELWEAARDQYDDDYDDDGYYYDPYGDYDGNEYEDEGYQGYSSYGYENASYLDFLQLEENVDELWWILDTLEEVYYAYDEAGAVMSDSLDVALYEMELEVESLLNLMETILELGPSSGDDDIMWAHEQFYDLMSRGPWELMDYAFQDLDSLCYYEDVEMELEYLIEDLANFKVFIDGFDELGVDDEDVSESVEVLKDLVGDVRYRVETIYEKYLDGDVSSDEAWEVLDSLRDVEIIAMDNMEVIVEYLIEHENLLDELFEFIPEQTDMVLSWVYDWDPEEPMEDDDYCGAGEYYDYTDEGYLDDEEFEEMIRYIPSYLWDELVALFGEDGAEEFLLEILREIETYGDLGAEFLENYSDVQHELDFNVEDFRYHGERLMGLLEDLDALYIPDEYVEEVISQLEHLKLLNDSGASEEEMLSVIEDLEATLNSIEYANYHGDKATRFYDVPEDAWMAPHVRKVKTNSIVQGYSDDNGPTGYYGPGDDVLLIEVLAISMRLAGEADESTDYPDEYILTLDELNISGLKSITYSDWNAPATREDAMVIMNRVLGLTPLDYVAGTFPDVDDSDDFAGDAMASYEAGLFTGEGGTGNLNPDAYMNRAAFAKVAGVALDYFTAMGPQDIDEFKKQLDDLVESL